MSRDAEIKRAKGQVAGDTNLKNKLDERRDLAVDLGSWTGMSNEVWQVSCHKLFPPIRERFVLIFPIAGSRRLFLSRTCPAWI